ncbi:MAG TPA: hypothetical protein VI320_30050 [Terracidiphilus sp.]|jgi:hypothetical protein
MSTKSSIRYENADESGKGFHLYEELFEEENVYLELEGFDFEASSTSLPSGKTNQRLLIRFPIEWANKLGLTEDRSSK